MNLLNLAQSLLHRRLLRQGGTSKEVDLLGIRIHYYSLQGTGKGPPMFMLHGLAGSALGYFALFLPFAKRFSRVLAIDFPGNGRSPLPAGGCTLERQRELLVAFGREVIGEPAFVLGNSLGGAFALSLAAESPGQVRALGLLAPAGAQFSPERQSSLLESLVVKDNADAREIVRRLFHKPPLLGLLFASEVRRVFTTPTVRATLQELSRHDIKGFEPSILKSIQAPTLLLWGESDGLLPKESVDYFRSQMPAHTRVEIVPGFGHVPQLESPAEVVTRINQFADEIGL